MTHIKSITIPNECHQSWNQMLVTTNGKHCENCNKTVVDFSVMTNSEIVTYLSANKNVCGRFANNQLEYLNHNLIKKDTRTPFFKNYRFAAILAGIMTLTKAEAKSHEPVKYIQLQQSFKNDIKITDTVKYIKVRGIVKDDNSNRIPGVTVELKGCAIKTTTNAKGYFELIMLPAQGYQLEFKYIGYQTKMVPIHNNKKSKYRVVLQPEFGSMGEVVITGN